MKLQGCCPPLARPRTGFGGEIIGFDPRTGQFVQAAAGAPARVGPYPYFASAGMGRGLGDATTVLSWGLVALMAAGAIYGLKIALTEA